MQQPPAYAQALATALPALPVADAPRSEPAHAHASTAPTASELPDYSAVPRLRAENLFWCGFAMPLLWIVGASRLIGLGREDPLKAASFRGKHASPSLEEAGIGEEAIWRFAREERKWARRSCRALIVSILLAGLIALVIVFIVIVQRRILSPDASSPTPTASSPAILATSSLAARPSPTGPPGGALRGFIST